MYSLDDFDFSEHPPHIYDRIDDRPRYKRVLSTLSMLVDPRGWEDIWMYLYTVRQLFRYLNPFYKLPR